MNKVFGHLAAAFCSLAMTGGALAQSSFTCKDSTGRTVSRVIGGAPVNQSDAPYQIFLITKSPDGKGSSVCGGSIISQGFVLTAAHCVSSKSASGIVPAKPDAVYAVFGGDNVSEMLEDKDIRPVSDLYIHPDYNGKNGNSDIAVLKLARPLDVDPTSIITLASPQMERALMGDYTCARVTGYGVTEDGETSEDLLGVNLRIRPESECRKFISKFRGARFTGGLLCAGYPAGNRTSCQGDSGGPLVIREGPTGLVQVGVVAWGAEGCDGRGNYGVYTRVSAFVPWILKVTK